MSDLVYGNLNAVNTVMSTTQLTSQASLFLCTPTLIKTALDRPPSSLQRVVYNRCHPIQPVYKTL